MHGVIKIKTQSLDNVEVVISNESSDLVRMGFNPSTLPEVNRLKALAAAFITECRCLGRHSDAQHAITLIRTACMFAVAEATKGK